MDAVIIYESMTGTTRRAAHAVDVVDLPDNGDPLATAPAGAGSPGSTRDA